MSGLRLMVFDKTCAGKHVLPGLSTAWRSGALLYRALGRLDASFGATSWDEAFGWLATFRAAEPIDEIQYWGHGNWGVVWIARDRFGAEAFASGHPLHTKLEAVRERLAPDALVWLRTCEAFGADRGLDFAARFADFTGVRVAGHTFIIDALQSGLHGVAPGVAPDWSPAEGILEGTPAAPKRARRSSPIAPRTVTCFDGTIPDGWIATT